MSLHSKILVGHKAATALLVAIDDKNGLCRKGGTADNHRMLTLVGNAGHQANDHLRVGPVDIGTDKRQGFTPRIVVQPDIDLVIAGPAERFHITCSRQPGPSRYERRRQHQSSHIAPRNLGTIEGERLRNTRGYHEDYGLAKNLASLAAVTALLLCAAVICGAI